MRHVSDQPATDTHADTVTNVDSAANTSSGPQKWEYFVTPLLLHNEAKILNNWGQKGWELVQIIEGPAGGNVAYLKRPLPAA